MCGIVGYIGQQDAVGILLDGLRRLEYRGYDSAGIAVQGPSGLDVRRSVGKIDRLRQITREQIRDAARKYLSRTNYAQLAFVPKRTQ